MANKHDIETILSFLQSGNITEDQRIRCMAKLIGYETLPPTVEEILDSDEYLNPWFGKKKLYPYWRERILELYPNPIETSSMVVINKGAIGTGKSFCAMAIAHIDLIKLSHLSEEAAHDYFGLTKGLTPWTYRCFNVNLPKASDLFITPMQTVISECEYWKSWRQINHMAMPCNLQLLPSSRPNQILSEALFGCIASELNFYRYDVATEIITKALGRMTSRFESGKFYFNHMILDSSDTFEDSCVEQFIKQGAYSDCQLINHVTSWDAKAHKGVYFNEGEFWVYLGDSNTMPFIIDDNPNVDMSRLDPERKLKVPRELYSEFKSDIIKSLQDKAGISVMTNTLFFTNKVMLSKHFNIDYELEDYYVIDFFDDVSLMDVIGKEKLLRALDLDRPVYIRCDLGVSGDQAGIGMCQFGHLIEKVVGDQIYKKPKWKIPVAFGVTRPKGQETPISKIEDFILELSQHVTVKMFTTDQYQSTELRQNVYRRSNGEIPVGYLSVDINDRCYVSYKNTMYEERLDCCKNSILMTEANEVQRMGNKVDHPKSGSKDILDAVVGAYWSAEQAGIEESATKGVADIGNYVDLLQKMKQTRKPMPYRGNY